MAVQIDCQAVEGCKVSMHELFLFHSMGSSGTAHNNGTVGHRPASAATGTDQGCKVMCTRTLEICVTINGVIPQYIKKAQ